jgi:hypothetical protein
MIRWSWSSDPELRPSMREILALLEVIEYKIGPNVDSGRVADFVAPISK